MYSLSIVDQQVVILFLRPEIKETNKHSSLNAVYGNKCVPKTIVTYLAQIQLHNKDNLHFTNNVQKTAWRRLEVLPYLACSPDLSPCYFLLFKPLKQALK